MDWVIEHATPPQSAVAAAFCRRSPKVFHVGCYEVHAEDRCAEFEPEARRYSNLTDAISGLHMDDSRMAGG